MIHDWVALQCRMIVQVCCMFTVKTKSRGVRAKNNTTLPFFLSQHDLATFELNSIRTLFPSQLLARGFMIPKVGDYLDSIQENY